MANNVHRIDRSSQYRVLANATDKPIEIWMYHRDAMVLIVNTKTGDICTQYFSGDRENRISPDGEKSTAQNAFLREEGEKKALIFNTNSSRTSDIENYKRGLEINGVKFETITADMPTFSNYERFKNGEIFLGFSIDLRNPKEIKALGREAPSKTYNQTTIHSVGNAPSASIIRILQKYDNYISAAAQFGLKDKDHLKRTIQESQLDLTLLQPDDNNPVLEEIFRKICNALSGNTQQILETLKYLKAEVPLSPEMMAYLIGKGASYATQEMARATDIKSQQEPAKALVDFADNFLQEQRGPIKAKCERIMKSGLSNLNAARTEHFGR